MKTLIAETSNGIPVYSNIMTICQSGTLPYAARTIAALTIYGGRSLTAVDLKDAIHLSPVVVARAHHKFIAARMRGHRDHVVFCVNAKDSELLPTTLLSVRITTHQNELYLRTLMFGPCGPGPNHSNHQYTSELQYWWGDKPRTTPVRALDYYKFQTEPGSEIGIEDFLDMKQDLLHRRCWQTRPRLAQAS